MEFRTDSTAARIVRIRSSPLRNKTQLTLLTLMALILVTLAAPAGPIAGLAMSTVVGTLARSACQFDDGNFDDGNRSRVRIAVMTAVIGCAVAVIAAARVTAIVSNRQVRLSATATKEASATTAVVARMLTVILNARATFAWSVAPQVVDTVVIAARNALIGLPPGARSCPGAISSLDDSNPSESSSIIVPQDRGCATVSRPSCRN